MKKIFSLLLLLVLMSLSCGKDNVKPSADSLAATEVMNVIEAIREAYEVKNYIVIQNHMDAELADSVKKYLYFENARLDLTPRFVRLTDTSVVVNLNWQGKWGFANNKDVTKGGAGNLVFHKETMKLTSIEGDNPFLTPGIRN